MLPTAVSPVGILAAFAVYAKGKFKAIEPKVLEQAWYYDAGASKLVGGPGAALFNGIAWVDAHIVDGAVNGTATLVRNIGGTVPSNETKSIPLSLTTSVQSTTVQTQHPTE